MTVRAYLRVSTNHQVEGFSLAVQRERADAWATYQGLGPVQHYEDGGISGRRNDRPALTMLLDDVEAGDTVLVYSLSRLGRGGVVQLLGTIKQIEDAGASLVSLTESIDTKTSAGRLLLTILAALAEMEVEQTKERTLAGKNRAAREGIWPIAWHTLPFGYRKDEEGRIMAHEPEMITVREVFRLSADGLSVKAIAQLLEEQEAEKRHPGQWLGTMVHDIRRYRYDRDYVEYRDTLSETVLQIPAPAVITEDQWHAAQRSRSRSNPYRNTQRFPLTGHLFCACGARMAGQTNNGGANLYYSCRVSSRRTPACPVSGRSTRSFIASGLEAQARQALYSALTQKDVLTMLLSKSVPEDTHAEQRAELERKRSALIELYLEGVIDRQELEERRNMFQRRIDTLQPEPAVVVDAPAGADQFADAALHLDSEDFNDLLQLLRVRFEVNPENSVIVTDLSLPL